MQLVQSNEYLASEANSLGIEANPIERAENFFINSNRLISNPLLILNLLYL